MSRLTSAQNHFDKALQSGVSSEIQAAAETWKAVAEAEKAEAEIIRAPARSERLRFWIPIAATLINSASLVCVFVFQVYQFQKTEALAQEQSKLAQVTLQLQLDQFKVTTEQTRQTAEDAEFRDVMEKVASHMEGPDVMIGLTLIKPFLESPRYGESAREIAVSLLSHIVEPDSFKRIIRWVGKETDWENFEDLTTISRNLNDFKTKETEEVPDTQVRVKNLQDEIAKLESPATQPTTSPSANTDTLVRRLRMAQTDLDRETAEIVDLKLTSEEIARFLKGHSRPPGYHLDLHGVQFIDADFTNMDFGDADLNEAKFDSCQFKDADMGQTPLPLSGSDWPNTAWWRAKRISPDLFEALKEGVQFDPTSSYAEPTTLADYTQNVNRLRSAYPTTSASSTQPTPK
jgi:hypothetical protein